VLDLSLQFLALNFIRFDLIIILKVILILIFLLDLIFVMKSSSPDTINDEATATNCNKKRE
jgi:hypothetical protein